MKHLDVSCAKWKKKQKKIYKIVKCGQMHLPTLNRMYHTTKIVFFLFSGWQNPYSWFLWGSRFFLSILWLNSDIIFY
jgi:hypothetical protein